MKTRILGMRKFFTGRKSAFLSAGLIVALTAGVAFLGSNTAEAHNVNKHQRHQMHRIHEGVRDGDLTRREAHQLIGQQRRIRHIENRYRADGHLNGFERHRLAVMQRNANHDIYRQRNDRWDR